MNTNQMFKSCELIRPELMSLEVLLEILMQKGAIRDTNVPRTREEALELYSRLVKPLPQRQYDTQRRFQCRLLARRKSKVGSSDYSMDCDDNTVVENYFSEIAPQSLKQKATITDIQCSPCPSSTLLNDRKRSPQMQNMDTSDAEISSPQCSKRAKVPVVWP